MNSIAKPFYNSKAWKVCREGYAKSKGGLCERCLKQGIYKPGDIVHHKTYITRDNMTDPGITLNWDNLELLCIECHNKEHFKELPKRYTVDDNGRITAWGD